MISFYREHKVSPYVRICPLLRDKEYPTPDSLNGSRKSCSAKYDNLEMLPTNICHSLMCITRTYHATHSQIVIEVMSASKNEARGENL